MKTTIIILLVVIFAMLLANLTVMLIKFIDEKMYKSNSEAYQRGYDYANDVSTRMAQNEARKYLAQMLQSYSIKDVVFAKDDVFVVKWNDGKSTHVKRKEGDVDNPFKAFCYCLLKQMYGDNWKAMFKKYGIVDTQAEGEDENANSNDSSYYGSVDNSVEE